MIKDRFQNPVVGNTVRLLLFALNSNNPAALSLIQKVEIYYLDPAAHTPANPDGRTLIQTIAGNTVLNPSLGTYEIDEFIDPVIYWQSGNFLDVWYIQYNPTDSIAIVTQYFTIYPELWITTPVPILYDFQFAFSPHKFRLGEVKPIEIEVLPNVPRATDLGRYYHNLAISADLKVSIAKNCDECQDPCETDLNLIVDQATTNYRDRNRAFYIIDTTAYDPGIYDIFFTLFFGSNTYMSETFQFQIYK
jgi:hypothetical protein